MKEKYRYTVICFILILTLCLTGCTNSSYNSRSLSLEVINHSRVLSPNVIANDYFSIIHSNLRVISEDILIGSIILKCEKDYDSDYFSKQAKILDLGQAFKAYSMFPCVVTDKQWDYEATRVTRAYLNTDGYLISSTPYHAGEFITISFNTGF